MEELDWEGEEEAILRMVLGKGGGSYGIECGEHGDYIDTGATRNVRKQTRSLKLMYDDPVRSLAIFLAMRGERER